MTTANLFPVWALCEREVVLRAYDRSLLRVDPELRTVPAWCTMVLGFEGGGRGGESGGLER